MIVKSSDGRIYIEDRSYESYLKAKRLDELWKRQQQQLREQTVKQPVKKDEKCLIKN